MDRALLSELRHENSIARAAISLRVGEETRMTVVLPTPENLDAAAALLREGGIVAIPTETVYGLAAHAFDVRAVARVFETKARPAFDPLIVHVLDETMLERVVARIPKRARVLIERFWPGPLTIVFEKHDKLPALVTSGNFTVAVRAPAHPVARALLERSDLPLAAPSANPFGRLSPTRAAHVQRMLGERVDLIVDGGPSDFGIESTIIAVEPRLAILRPGAIAREAIEEAAGEAVGPALAVASEPAVPGRLPYHYAPRTPLRVIDSGTVSGARRAGAALVTLSRGAEGYAAVRQLSEAGDLREAAARLFDVLHELDELGLERIDVEPVPEVGLGVAIMDRLRRAERR
jgi:L-threonylcarbamoyladenylate synthase